MIYAKENNTYILLFSYIHLLLDEDTMTAGATMQCVYRKTFNSIATTASEYRALMQ